MRQRVATMRQAATLGGVLKGLSARAAELGLRLSACDTQSTRLSAMHPCSDFCRMVCRDGGCGRPAEELARHVLRTGEPARSLSPTGCRLIGLPLLERRRLSGAMILGYPTREMLDEERLALLCDRMGLDRQAMLRHARGACRHGENQAEDFQRIFTWLLESQQNALRSSIDLTSLSSNLANTYEGLNLLYAVSGSMNVAKRPRDFLQDLCQKVREVLSVEMAVVEVYDPRAHMGGDIVVHAGLDVLDSGQLRLLAATYVIPRLAGGQTLVDNTFHHDGQIAPQAAVRSLLAVPLQVEQEPIGLLMAVNKPGDFDSFDAGLLGSIASQASVFLANHRMFVDLQDLLMGVLHSLTESIDAKDPYTCGHSHRVAAISRRLAEACGFNATRVQEIYLSGLLHDVGKIGVPEAILRKDGKLTLEEYEAVKRHPLIGAKILDRIPQLGPVIPGVLSHHEKIDGRGYPHGLTGEGIPIEGRIVGLADGWDAMTSHRTYRRARPLAEAMGEIRRCSGSQFDPDLATILLSWDLDDYMKQLHESSLAEIGWPG